MQAEGLKQEVVLSHIAIYGFGRRAHLDIMKFLHRGNGAAGRGTDRRSRALTKALQCRRFLSRLDTCKRALIESKLFRGVY